MIFRLWPEIHKYNIMAIIPSIFTNSDNELTRLRRAFQIPDTVIIRPFVKLNLTKSNINANADTKYAVPVGVSPDEAIATSILNTPVYTNIQFGAGSYETNTKGVFRSFPELTYNAVLITVSQAKKIIKTDIQGRDGTVKEYIGLDDFAVQVNGIITGSNGHYPIDEVASLKKMLDAPIAIDVSCTYLQNLGIVSLVAENYEFGQEAGGYSYQSFSLTFASDIPQELRISDI